MSIKIIPPNEKYAASLHQWRNEPISLNFNPIKPRPLQELQKSLSETPTGLSWLKPACP